MSKSETLARASTMTLRRRYAPKHQHAAVLSWLRGTGGVSMLCSWMCGDAQLWSAIHILLLLFDVHHWSRL